MYLRRFRMTVIAAMAAATKTTITTKTTTIAVMVALTDDFPLADWLLEFTSLPCVWQRMP